MSKRSCSVHNKYFCFTNFFVVYFTHLDLIPFSWWGARNILAIYKVNQPRFFVCIKILLWSSSITLWMLRKYTRNFFPKLDTTAFLFLGLLGSAFSAFLTDLKCEDLWLNPSSVESEIGDGWSFILFLYCYLYNCFFSNLALFFSGLDTFIPTLCNFFLRPSYTRTFSFLFSR